MIFGRFRYVFVALGFQKIYRYLRGKVVVRRYRFVVVEQQGIEQMIVVVVEYGEVRMGIFDGMDYVAQVGDGVDGVFDVDNIVARVGEGFYQRRSQILFGQRREVIEYYRQRDVVGYLFEIADQVRFRYFLVVGVDYYDVVRVRLLRVLVEFDGFSGVGVVGVDQYRYATIDMIDSKAGNGFTFFGVELGEFVIVVQEEQVVNVCFDQIVDQRGGVRFIELVVGGKNGGDRGNDFRE